MLPSLALIVCWLGLSGIPEGPGSVELQVEGHRIEVYTYKPAGYRDGPMILVVHGVLRNAETYRDDAREMGDRFGALIAAPRLDAEQFPGRKFQQGGLLLSDGQLAPEAEWTWSLIPKLANELRRIEERPEAPYYLIGHSAGAQFVKRMAGFVASGAVRLVAANPGTVLLPTVEFAYPGGFGGLPGEPAVAEERLRAYLAQPLTLYLGTADNQRDAYLAQDAESDRAGQNRLERGRTAYRMAEDLARRRGWPFGWRLVEAPDVAHDHTAMFNHPRCREALFGPEDPDLPGQPHGAGLQLGDNLPSSTPPATPPTMDPLSLQTPASDPSSLR